MEISKSKIDDLNLVLVEQLHQLRVINVGSSVHASATTGPATGFPPTASALGISAPAASGLPASLTLLKEIIAVSRKHAADTRAHKIADATSLPALSAPVDLASAQTAANAIKAWLEAHGVGTTLHYTADVVNVVADDATDQDTLETLLAELKTALPTHIAKALAGHSIQLIGP